MLQGDLVARVRWLAQHDRCALVQLLATLDVETLDVARRLAGRDVGPERPRPADNLGRG